MLKTKRIVIAGCRYYNDYDQAREYIDRCVANIKENNTLIIMSGGCTGADMLGERYANEHGLELERYPADWKKHGRSAGPKRNELMAQGCDYVICFWDGKSSGTRSMIEFARHYHKPIRIKRI